MQRRYIAGAIRTNFSIAGAGQRLPLSTTGKKLPARNNTREPQAAFNTHVKLCITQKGHNPQYRYILNKILTDCLPRSTITLARLPEK